MFLLTRLNDDVMQRGRNFVASQLLCVVDGVLREAALYGTLDFLLHEDVA